MTIFPCYLGAKRLACGWITTLMMAVAGAGGAQGATTNTIELGIASDFFFAGDYDGDGRTDPAVWRPGVAGEARLMYFASAAGVIRTNIIGQTGDDPTVVGDYDGDGRADPAVFRDGSVSGETGKWVIIYSSSGTTTTFNWGVNGNFPCPGD